jgi:CheY-like chemotaxis protein
MNGTILLADDSLTIQKVVELTFADTDFEVVALSSGDDLLERLPETQPDLVICDIIMPGKDGYEVCQEIKSDPNTLHIPVILLSGTFEPFDRDRALAAGCSEIMTKPFEARKLVDTVERLLSSGAADQATAPAEGAVEPPVEEAVATPMDAAPAEPSPTAEESPMAVEAAPELPPQPPSSDVETGPSLDFTDTGFAEMEAAAEIAIQPPTDLPEDGLDFEFNDDFESFGDPESTEEASSTDTEPDLDISEEAVAAAPATAADTELSEEPATAVAEEPVATDGPTEGPFPEETTDHGVAPAAREVQEPFVTRAEVVPPQEPEFDQAQTDRFPTESAELPPPLTTSPGEVPIPEVRASHEVTPPDSGASLEAASEEPEAAPVAPTLEVSEPEPEAPEWFAEDEPGESVAESELAEGDTDDVSFTETPETPSLEVEPPSLEVEAPSPEVEAPPPVEEAVRPFVETVAPVVEAAPSTEAPPEVQAMLSVVVRQRIRELEADAEQSTPDTQLD